MTARFRFLTAALALGLGIAALAAEPALAGVNGREHYQRDRIRAGRADGSLTARETHRLANRQLCVERMEQRMRADDGRLGPRERLRLDRALDRSSAAIWWQRHDRQSR